MFLVGAAGSARAAIPIPVQPAEVVKTNSYILTFDGGRLAGPGSDVLREAARSAQFVLLGEEHYVREIPLFADALYRALHVKFGFHHLAIEQDPVAMGEAVKPALRGDARALGELAHGHPSLFEFASDQDLELLAEVGRLETGPDPLWGLEQPASAVRWLEELRPLAHGETACREAADLLEQARAHQKPLTYDPTFLAEPSTHGKLQRLQQDFAAAPGSRADELLRGLVKSAEIYSYYTRAAAGEPAGIFNNTVKETWFKELFMRDFRRAAMREKTPKVMFKFGGYHLFRGMEPTGAYPIGNFAHEFAICNGTEALGIMTVAL